MDQSKELFFAKCENGFLSTELYEQATTPRPWNYKNLKSS